MRRTRDVMPWKLVHRKKRNVYVLRYCVAGTWREMTTGCAKKKDAQRFAANAIAGLSTQVNTQTNFVEFCESYSTQHLSGLAAKSQEAFWTAVARLENLCPVVLLEEITTELIARWAMRLRSEGKSEATIEAYRSHLMAGIRWAASIGLIAEAPKLPRLRRVNRGTKSRGRGLKQEEIERIAMALPRVVGQQYAKQWAWNLEALHKSGMRLGETFLLSWDTDAPQYITNLRSGRPRIVISAGSEKGFRNRTLPLTPDFAALLRRTIESRQKGPVFRWPLSRGDSLSIKTVGKRISAAGRLAGVIVGTTTDGLPRYATAHDFRRTFGMRWAPRVMPIVLRDMMRHESLDTTMQYYVDMEADRIGDIIWSAAENSSEGDMLEALAAIDCDD